MNCCRMLEVMNDFYLDEVTETAGVAIAERIETIGEKTEVAAVGTCVGGSFQNINELKVLKFDEAIKSADKEEWTKAIDGEL